MNACVFLGPTLSPRDARAVLDAVYLPPVQEGDVWRAVARYRPRAIGIIDGYFQHVPSVWHKEILWAMAEGVHVFGGASMGALRAAELAAFGMRGVGRIFEAYRDGVFEPYTADPFEDDDEVAVVHGPPDSGYAALSEAMVNIRRTLAVAAGAGVIRPDTRDALAGIAKALFYPDRSWEQALRLAAQRSLPADDLAALRAWLPAGRVDQKRDDAVAMLAEMQALLATDPLPARAGYVFQRSEMWDRAAGLAFSTPIDSRDAPQDGPREAVLDELRLDGRAYVEARRAGLLRLAALCECDRQNLDPRPEDRQAAAAELRRRFTMFRREDVDRWLADNDLDRDGLDRLIEDEARLLRLDRTLGSVADAHAVDQLRASGEYARYAARARAKQRAPGRCDPGAEHLDEWTRFRLTVWYFEQRLGGRIPDDLDGYVTRAGFPDADAFYRAVLREYRYLASGGRPADAREPDRGVPPHAGAPGTD